MFVFAKPSTYLPELDFTYIIRFSKSICSALWFNILYTDVICTVHKDQNYTPLFSNVGQFAKSHFDHAHFFATLKNTFTKKVKEC